MFMSIKNIKIERLSVTKQYWQMAFMTKNCKYKNTIAPAAPAAKKSFKALRAFW
jgi:hypothetical protein